MEKVAKKNIAGKVLSVVANIVFAASILYALIMFYPLYIFGVSAIRNGVTLQGCWQNFLTEMRIMLPSFVGLIICVVLRGVAASKFGELEEK